MLRKNVSKFFIGLILVSNICYAKERILEIATTIKPIYSITKAVTNGASEVSLVLEENASLHDITLKPSMARRLRNSDVVIMINREFEYFADINYKTSQHIIELSKLEGIKLLPTRTADLVEPDHHHGSTDYHLWLDPDNTKIIAIYLRDFFSKQDPQNANIYQHNTEKFLRLLEEKTNKISTDLAKYKNLKFILFHDSTQYFEDYFKLRALYNIPLEESYVGIKTITKIKKLVSLNQIDCSFSEPYINHKVIERIGIKDIKIDTEFGEEKENGYGSSYIRLMEDVAKDFESCAS